MNIARSSLFLVLIAFSFSALAQVSPEYCGSLKNAFGPFDYRSDHYIRQGSDPMPHSEKRRLVEGAHFTPRVESLIGAQSGGQIGPPGADLDYTLRAFPNNHRALVSVMRYGEKTASQQPQGLRYVVECYFERALRFAPDDNVVRMIYADFLKKANRKPEAMQQLDAVVKTAKDSAFTHHNAGLLYFELQEYESALTQAHKAIELGLNRPDLRDKLHAAGKWRDPDAGATVPAEPASAASSAVKP